MTRPIQAILSCNEICYMRSARVILLGNRIVENVRAVALQFERGWQRWNLTGRPRCRLPWKGASVSEAAAGRSPGLPVFSLLEPPRLYLQITGLHWPSPSVLCFIFRFPHLSLQGFLAWDPFQCIYTHTITHIHTHTHMYTHTYTHTHTFELRVSL